MKMTQDLGIFVVSLNGLLLNPRLLFMCSVLLVPSLTLLPRCQVVCMPWPRTYIALKRSVVVCPMSTCFGHQISI